MGNCETLLPPNSTDQERAIECAAARMADVPVPVGSLWNPEECPEHALPWLAWALSVDEWSSDWTQEQKRGVIAGAMYVHEKKGTPSAVKNILESTGYPDARIIEHAEQDAAWQAAGGKYLDGSFSLGGAELAFDGAPDVMTTHWAQYMVEFNLAEAPAVTEDQAWLRERIKRVAPVRSHLAALLYRFSVAFDAQIKLSPLSALIEIDYDQCRRAPVHSAQTMDGCWSLSDAYSDVFLTGWRLDGRQMLTGQKPEGDLLDAGWGETQLEVSKQYPMGAKAIGADDWTLDNDFYTSRLDGEWRFDSETLHGNRLLSGGWRLDVATLGLEYKTMLDGTRTLGRSSEINHAGLSASGLLIDGRIAKEITL